MYDEQFVRLLDDRLSGHDGQTPAEAVKRLVTPYLADPDRADPDTDRAVATLLVRREVVQLREVADVFAHNTRPWFVVALALALVVLGGGFLWVLSPPGRDTWMALLLISMGYVCLRLLPQWRRQVPVLGDIADRLETLASRMERPEIGQPDLDPPDLDPPNVRRNTVLETVELRKLGRTILTKAGYTSPLFRLTDLLLDRLVAEEQESAA